MQPYDSEVDEILFDENWIERHAREVQWSDPVGDSVAGRVGQVQAWDALTTALEEIERTDKQRSRTV